MASASFVSSVIQSDPAARVSLRTKPFMSPADKPRRALTAAAICSTFVPTMTPPLTRADRELQMLESLVDCAYALAMAVGEAARGEPVGSRALALYGLFQDGFRAVRMGVRLSMTLRTAPRALPAAAPWRPERLDGIDVDRPDRPDTDRPDTDRPERLDVERERETEAVSLPDFLSALGVVSRRAQALDVLPDAVRARELPALRERLAEAGAPGGASAARPSALAPAQATSPLPRSPAAPPGRAALFGSAAPPRLDLPGLPPRSAPG